LVEETKFKLGGKRMNTKEQIFDELKQTSSERGGK